MFPDFSTSETALATLEDAYNRKDINGAVAAKDFPFEARAMLLSLENLNIPLEESLVIQTAEVLELAFKKMIPSEWFPGFTLPRCEVVSRKHLQEDMVELVEEFTFPSGGKSKQVLHAAKNATGGISSSSLLRMVR
jgi:hypothetical protein